MWLNFDLKKVELIAVTIESVAWISCISKLNFTIFFCPIKNWIFIQAAKQATWKVNISTQRLAQRKVNIRSYLRSDFLIVHLGHVVMPLVMAEFIIQCVFLWYVIWHLWKHVNKITHSTNKIKMFTVDILLNYVYSCKKQDNNVRLCIVILCTEMNLKHSNLCPKLHQLMTMVVG